LLAALIAVRRIRRFVANIIKHFIELRHLRLSIIEPRPGYSTGCPICPSPGIYSAKRSDSSEGGCLRAAEQSINHVSNDWWIKGFMAELVK
jgi:hypothetical protein